MGSSMAPPRRPRRWARALPAVCGDSPTNLSANWPYQRNVASTRAGRRRSSSSSRPTAAAPACSPRRNSRGACADARTTSPAVPNSRTPWPPASTAPGSPPSTTSTCRIFYATTNVWKYLGRGLPDKRWVSIGVCRTADVEDNLRLGRARRRHRRVGPPGAADRVRRDEPPTRPPATSPATPWPTTAACTTSATRTPDRCCASRDRHAIPRSRRAWSTTGSSAASAHLVEPDRSTARDSSRRCRRGTSVRCNSPRWRHLPAGGRWCRCWLRLRCCGIR